MSTALRYYRGEAWRAGWSGCLAENGGRLRQHLGECPATLQGWGIIYGIRIKSRVFPLAHRGQLMAGRLGCPALSCGMTDGVVPLSR